MELYDKLAIPESCRVGNTVFKKLFYDNGGLSKQDRTLLTDGVEKIRWVYCLKPETINIPVYRDEEHEYLEIELLEVVLTADKGLRRIAEIIMRTIPYPMLLFFRLGNRFQLWTAHLRVNLADERRLTAESFEHTDWLDADTDLLDALNIKTMRWSNYYMLYSCVVDAISIWRARQLMIDKEAELTGDEARRLLVTVEEIDSQIAKLRAELKKEAQFNRKMELNIKAKKLEQQRHQMIHG
jgi:hypothetical protein